MPTTWILKDHCSWGDRIGCMGIPDDLEDYEGVVSEFRGSTNPPVQVDDLIVLTMDTSIEEIAKIQLTFKIIQINYNQIPENDRIEDIWFGIGICVNQEALS